MVRLNRIYTRKGDDGTTGLGDGRRIAKHHPRIAAYGTVDELSAVIGLITAHGVAPPMQGWLVQVQNELFDVGADLCVPGTGGERLRITAPYTKRLEAILDELNEGLAPLQSFVLPGGKPAAAWLHLARTVCRRAERHVTELVAMEGEQVNPEVIRYLNRLSDLFFVMARAANDNGSLDVLWNPGKHPG